MKTLLSLILVIIISVTTEALVCHSCESFLKSNCIALTSETCPENVTSCFSQVTMQKFGKLTLHQSSRGCPKSKEMCVCTFNMTMGYMEVHSLTKCCEGDNCNNEILEIVIPKNLKENGVECPACAEIKKNCTSEKIYKCKGVQNRCFEFSGGLLNKIAGVFDDWTLKGCTTEELCDHQEAHGEFDSPNLKKGYKLQCSKK